MFGGDAGRSPGERPHDVIAGESSPLSGTPSERGDRLLIVLRVESCSEKVNRQVAADRLQSKPFSIS